jgi:hypothetical protein
MITRQQKVVFALTDTRTPNTTQFVEMLEAYTEKFIAYNNRKIMRFYRKQTKDPFYVLRSTEYILKNAVFCDI